MLSLQLKWSPCSANTSWEKVFNLNNGKACLRSNATGIQLNFYRAGTSLGPVVSMGVESSSIYIGQDPTGQVGNRSFVETSPVCTGQVQDRIEAHVQPPYMHAKKYWSYSKQILQKIMCNHFHKSICFIIFLEENKSSIYLRRGQEFDSIALYYNNLTMAWPTQCAYRKK